MINVFEEQFKEWFRNSIYYKPIRRCLTLMIFPKDIISFIMWEFSYNFVLYIRSNY
jgi:hypothetical protein